MLGVCQCVLWGVLYYSFSVFLVPMEQGLALSRPIVAGAFSVGLLAMALAAPMIGRWLDRGWAARSFRVGVVLALGGLLAIRWAQGLITLYFAWLMLGLAMAMLLYESAFALVIRAVTDPTQRLRALAAVTVMGGLASTIFLPVLAWLIDRIGWRPAALWCALAVLLVAILMEVLVFPVLSRGGVPTGGRERKRGPWPTHFGSLIAMFSTGTLAAMALTTLLIPLLLARGATPAQAAAVLAALGAAQLPGRIWLLRSGNHQIGRPLIVWPIALQAGGLLAIVIAPSPWPAAAGVAIFGLGAGLQTLTRPWLVQALYGVGASGRWNGELARIQGFARAAGPVIATGAAWLVGTPAVLMALGLLLGLTLQLARTVPVETADPLSEPA